MKDISQYFQTRPRQYGLRGDAPLWEDFIKVFRDQPVPESEKELLQLLLTHFETLVGQPPVKGEDYFVPKYDKGGMSRGMVNSDFWLKIGFPMIITAFLDDKPDAG